MALHADIERKSVGAGFKPAPTTVENARRTDRFLIPAPSEPEVSPRIHEEFKKKEERLESLPWQTEESLSERGKGKPMQPVAEYSASQGDDGDFLALGPAGALEQEDQLFLLGAFANQTRHSTAPRSRASVPVIPAQAGIQHSTAFSGFPPARE
jgi:hypothetical protein